MHVSFEYRDKYTKSEWHKQECDCGSIKECIDFYGLDLDDVEVRNLKIEEN